MTNACAYIALIVLGSLIFPIVCFLLYGGVMAIRVMMNDDDSKARAFLDKYGGGGLP